MPRKTLRLRVALLYPVRFNEAAARCRGKRRLVVEPGKLVGASMRPRPDAAENRLAGVMEGRSDGGASMRPRPDAAENPRARTATPRARPCFNEAAARCRGKQCGGAVGDRPRRPPLQ